MEASVNALSSWRNGVGPGFDAAAGERDIGRHNDIAARDALGDPVIGGIEAIADDDTLRSSDRAELPSWNWRRR